MHQHLDPSFINIGDLVVQRGAKHLFPQRTDLLVGTPWFWDKCSQSAKYQWLNTLLDNGQVKSAIGVGSCFPLGMDESVILNDPEESEALRAAWSRFDKVVVRDPLAHRLLTHLGIPNILLPCPSVFAIADTLPLPEPRLGSTVIITGVAWDNSSQFLERQKVFDHGHDTAYLSYGYGRITAADVPAFLRNLGQYETLIGERVHAITPFVTVRRTAICPVDSRHLTALNAGVSLYPSIAEPAGQHKLDEWRDAYLSYLT